MASIENSLKYESEVEPGKIRLVTSGEFVRAYNRSAWLFYCCISKYKVIRKYSKQQQKDVYFLGFPVSKLLELANGRVCTKTDFGYDVIHDPKMREVFAAEFRDRVVHHLFYNYTHELFERTFIADSYSCIEGRGTHYGVERLKHHLLSCSQNWTKPCYVLKLDVKGYFMSINRARLLVRCRELLGRVKCSQMANGTIVHKSQMANSCDARKPCRICIDGIGGNCEQLRFVNNEIALMDWPLVDYLLESICMLDPVANCRIIGDRDEWKLLPKEKSLFNSKPGCGLPIGNLSSQLFSNVYLGVFDDFMKRELKCRHYGRYVDDAYVVASSKEELWRIVPRAREFLRDELELELNEAKVRVIDARRGVEFLGAYVKPYRTYPANKALRRMRGRLKSLDWSEGPDKAQTRVNSMLGVLSHYDCWHVRKVITWEARLREHGRVTDDCLRFEPDRLPVPHGVVVRQQGGATDEREDATLLAHDLVHDAIGADDQLTEAVQVAWRGEKACERNPGTHGGHRLKEVDLLGDLGMPPDAVLVGERRDDGSDLLRQLSTGMVRPVNGHASVLSSSCFLSRAIRSWCEMNSPRSNWSREISTDRESSSRSRRASLSAQRSSKSDMSNRMEAACPFCVMTSGRCVRRVRCMQSARVWRHSVYDTTSLSRRGRCKVISLTGIESPVGETPILYSKPYRHVKGDGKSNLKG